MDALEREAERHKIVVVGSGINGHKSRKDYERALAGPRRSLVHPTEELDRQVAFWVLNIYLSPGEQERASYVYRYRSLKDALVFVIYDQFTLHPTDVAKLLVQFNLAISAGRLVRYSFTGLDGELQWAIDPGY